jgi:hypothetical protein
LEVCSLVPGEVVIAAVGELGSILRAVRVAP